MIKKITSIALLLFFATSGFALVNTQRAFAATCESGNFFGLPSWSSHLEIKSVTITDPDTNESQTSCTPQIKGINDIWKIVASVLEMLLRIATLVAIGFVVYGGVTYTLSQGSPDKTKEALKTIINALVGLAISIVSAALVGFIAGRF